MRTHTTNRIFTTLLAAAFLMSLSGCQTPTKGSASPQKNGTTEKTESDQRILEALDKAKAKTKKRNTAEEKRKQPPVVVQKEVPAEKKQSGGLRNFFKKLGASKKEPEGKKKVAQQAPQKAPAPTPGQPPVAYASITAENTPYYRRVRGWGVKPAGQLAKGEKVIMIQPEAATGFSKVALVTNQKEVFVPSPFVTLNRANASRRSPRPSKKVVKKSPPKKSPPKKSSPGKKDPVVKTPPLPEKKAVAPAPERKIPKIKLRVPEPDLLPE